MSGKLKGPTPIGARPAHIERVRLRYEDQFNPERSIYEDIPCFLVNVPYFALRDGNGVGRERTIGGIPP